MLFTYAYGPNYGWNSYLNRYNSYQNITRNLQAISAVSRIGESSLSPVSPVSRVPAVQSGRNLLVNNKQQLSSDSLDFLKQYQQKLTDLSTAAAKTSDLLKGTDWSKLEVTNTKPEVATVRMQDGAVNRAEYSVNVEQMAQKQVTTLRATDNDGNATSKFQDGTLRLEVNRKDGDGNNLGMNIEIKTENKTEEQVQQDIVDQVNAQADTLGVRASLVSNKDGGKDIQLESVKTGASQAFLVTASDGANQLDVTNTQQAQNLSYTVEKRLGETGLRIPSRKESETNTAVTVDETGNKGLVMDVKSTGETDITVKTDSNALTEQTSKLVKAYNEAAKMLAGNTERGAGVSRAARSLKDSAKLSLAMEDIGISWGANNELKFDADTFQQQLEKNPTKVRGVLERSNLIKDISSSAKSAMEQSSASLLSKSEKKEKDDLATTIQKYYYQGAQPAVYQYAPYLFQNPMFFNLYI